MLENLRSTYLDLLRSEIATLRREADPGVRVTPEVLLEIGGGGFYQSLFRADVTVSQVDEDTRRADSARFIEINANPPESKTVSETQVSRMGVKLYPVIWNTVEFRPESGLSLNIEAWFQKWMDPEDERLQDEWGLGGVIHSVMVDETTGGLSVDFGSAPAQALEEILWVYSEAGASTLQVGSFDYLEFEPSCV